MYHERLEEVTAEKGKWGNKSGYRVLEALEAKKQLNH